MEIQVLTAITSTITVAVANDAPTVSGNDATLAYTENDGAVLAIDSTPSLADVDNANLAGATITISSGFGAGGGRCSVIHCCEWNYGNI